MDYGFEFGIDVVFFCVGGCELGVFYCVVGYGVYGDDLRKNKFWCWGIFGEVFGVDRFGEVGFVYY